MYSFTCLFFLPLSISLGCMCEVFRGKSFNLPEVSRAHHPFVFVHVGPCSFRRLLDVAALGLVSGSCSNSLVMMEPCKDAAVEPGTK